MPHAMAAHSVGAPRRQLCCTIQFFFFFWGGGACNRGDAVRGCEAAGALVHTQCVGCRDWGGQNYWIMCTQTGVWFDVQLQAGTVLLYLKDHAMVVVVACSRSPP
jgi:hypothetical protein